MGKRAALATPPPRSAADGLLAPWNRKFIGAKFRLLPFLHEAIVARAGARIGSLIEPFAGTGALACHLLERGIVRRAVLIDLLRTNTVVLRGCLGPGPIEPDGAALDAIVARLNALPPRAGGYASRVYGGRYFTEQNAARIDAIREGIARLVHAGEVGERARALLIGGLLLAADRVANTVGQYDAFLKHLGRESYDAGGRHLVDGSVYAPLRLRLPRAARDLDVLVREGDAVALVSEHEADVAYVDPPYNTRQYCDNYHVLENIARWEKPPVHGVTAKFDRTGLKSDFSSKRRAAGALAALVGRLRARRWIFLSYSDEGILDRATIEAVLRRRGEVELIEHEYRVFGNGGGRSRDRAVVEHLWAVRVRRRP